MIEIEPLAIPEVKRIIPARFRDDRGYFSEIYNRRRLAELGIEADFCQDNHSLSTAEGTLRGLHFQAPPFAQAKLVRVLRGAILDVAVDAREGSPTFGRHVSTELSAENGAQLFVPAGFLHGFVTRAPDTEVAYKVNAHYDRTSEGSVLWNDPDLAIDWGIPSDAVILSGKDAIAPIWADFKTPFTYH